MNTESAVRIKTGIERGAYVRDVFVRRMRLHNMKYVFVSSRLIHCRLILALFADKLYSKIRSEFDSLSRSGVHSAVSILHTLSVSAEPSRNRHDSLSILADMLLLALVKNLRTACAVEVFYYVSDCGYRLSLLSCNPLLNSLIKEEKIDMVGVVYKEMIQQRISPNVITFNTVINGLCKVGKLGRAVDLMEDMKSWGFIPTVVSFNTLIDGYCKNGGAGKMYRADALLKQMVAANVCPNVAIMTIRQWRGVLSADGTRLRQWWSSMIVLRRRKGKGGFERK